MLEILTGYVYIVVLTYGNVDFNQWRPQYSNTGTYHTILVLK